MAHLNPLAQIRQYDLSQAHLLLRDLPSLKPEELPQDEPCPICFLPFESILEEEREHKRSIQEKTASSSQASGPGGVAEEYVGIVKLSNCGHIFCRRDVAEWIESFHGSCPTCRSVFFEFTPVNEADYESSDGGEYIPDEDDDEEMEDDDDDDLFTEEGIPSSDVDITFSDANYEGASEARVGYDDSIMDGEEDEEPNSSLSTVDGLTDGSDTLSSEDASLDSDADDEEAYAGDVSMTSEGDDQVDLRSSCGDLDPKYPGSDRTEDGEFPFIH